MSNAQAKKGAKELDSLIKAAIKKVNATKENDLCRYIPISSGGYIHHFTMRKMKGENPAELAKMVSKYIINTSKPKKVTPKKRAPRGSRKPNQYRFTNQDIEKMLNMARLAGDMEMVRKLTPKKDFKALKRALISSIKRDEVDQELWCSYVESVGAQEDAASEAS